MASKFSLFNSLQFPAYRCLLGSLFLGFMCWNVQTVLVSWLVLETTDSPTMLGLIMAITFAPRILGVISGTITDRIDKRWLLMVVNSIQTGSSIALGSLILGGDVQLWHVALIVLVNGTLNTFSMPTQQAFTVDLVGMRNTTNATSLTNMSMFIAGMIGPSLVGAFVNVIGFGMFFYINAICFGFATVLVIQIKRYQPSSSPQPTPLARSIRHDIVEGFRYSWRNRTVFGGIMVFIMTNLFMWPCAVTSIPVFTRDVLRLDAVGLGWLTAANRLGGFTMNAIIASYNPRRKGRLLIVASMIWGGAWLGFAAVPWLPVSIVLLFTLGVTSSLTMTIATVILLTYARSDVRGRVMGIQTLSIAMMSPGSLIVGVLAETVGVILTISIVALMFIVAMVITIWRVSELRRVGDESQS
ncbi:MAG: MFS transporter [Candidatus Hermodarchaeia archaeon]